jgi:16S rRNA C1402 (ribose-2'-O) methylase RsmI
MPEALVFLESPHRIRATLADIAGLSNKRMLVGREMTKQFETFLVGPAEQLLGELAEQPKGEFVCIVEAGEQVTAGFDVSNCCQHLWRTQKGGLSNCTANGAKRSKLIRMQFTRYACGPFGQLSIHCFDIAGSVAMLT